MPLSTAATHTPTAHVAGTTVPAAHTVQRWRKQQPAGQTTHPPAAGGACYGTHLPTPCIQHSHAVYGSSSSVTTAFPSSVDPLAPMATKCVGVWEGFGRYPRILGRGNAVREI